MDDGTCKMTQTCSPRVSYSIDIPVGQVAPETGVPSGYCLKDQQMKVKGHKVLQMQELKKIAVSCHTKKPLRLQVAHQGTLQGLQVPTLCHMCSP